MNQNSSWIPWDLQGSEKHSLHGLYTSQLVQGFFHQQYHITWICLATVVGKSNKNHVTWWRFTSVKSQPSPNQRIRWCPFMALHASLKVEFHRTIDDLSFSLHDCCRKRTYWRKTWMFSEYSIPWFQHNWWLDGLMTEKTIPSQGTKIFLLISGMFEDDDFPNCPFGGIC